MQDVETQLRDAGRRVALTRQRLSMKLHGNAIALDAWHTADGNHRPELAIARLGELVAEIEQSGRWPAAANGSTQPAGAPDSPGKPTAKELILTGVREVISVAAHSRTLGLSHVHVAELQDKSHAIRLLGHASISSRPGQ